MIDEFDSTASLQRCRDHRKLILRVSQQVPALHVGPAFSCLEIIDTIYYGLMRKKGHDFQDTFILSKGHGCMAQYAVLHSLGILTDDDIDNCCSPGGRLGAHPDYGLPGVEASTGSLGHGFGLSVGIAYAHKMRDEDVRLFVVISDGELQEGSTWEAFMMASNLKLNNLTVLVDLNDRTTLEKLSVRHPAIYPLDKKLEAFNWNVHTIDGHDPKAVFEAGCALSDCKPNFIACRTIKGKGVSYMEDQTIWHYRSPNPEEYQRALKELETIGEEVYA